MEKPSETEIQRNADPDVIQMTSLREENMQSFASTLTGADSRSTVAVAGVGEEFWVYSQSSLSSKSGLLGSYDNVKLKWDTSPERGYHAETMAMMDAHGQISSIAASQPICKRCQAALTVNEGCGLKNPGDQFTENWQAPFTEEIDEKNSYPAKAHDPSRNGQSGSRWGMTSDRLYPIAKLTWSPHHDDGW